MGQTLTHGVYLPDEGERNCYSGLAANWQLLDSSVGTIAEHTTALAGKAPAVHTHTKSDITDFPAYGNAAGTICEGNDARLSDARTPVAHTHTKSDVTDLLNSNFIPSSDGSYTLGSSDLRWKQIWTSSYKTKATNIDFTDSTTTGSRQTWWVDTLEKNGTSFFGVGSIRTHSLGLNEEHFRIKNAGGKWADLYIQLNDNNQFTIGAETHPDVTNNGFRGKFTPLNSFIPYVNNSYDLGSSSYQWNNLYAKRVNTQTLNGINPGALSLPDMGTTADVNYFDFTSTITPLDGTDIFYRPPVDGWMTIIIAGTALALFEDAASSNPHVHGSGVSAAPVKGYCEATIPVHKNVRVKINAIGTSVYMAQVRPCMGNV